MIRIFVVCVYRMRPPSPSLKLLHTSADAKSAVDLVISQIASNDINTSLQALHQVSSVLFMASVTAAEDDKLQKNAPSLWHWNKRERGGIGVEGAHCCGGIQEFCCTDWESHDLSLNGC